MLLPQGVQKLVKGQDLERAITEGCEHRGAVGVRFGDELVVENQVDDAEKDEAEAPKGAQFDVGL